MGYLFAGDTLLSTAAENHMRGTFQSVRKK